MYNKGDLVELEDGKILTIIEMSISGWSQEIFYDLRDRQGKLYQIVHEGRIIRLVYHSVNDFSQGI